MASGVASPKLWGDKIFDFRRITLFCLEKRLSKHKMTIFSKNLGGMAPFPPWLRLCRGAGILPAGLTSDSDVHKRSK